ncbi:MAG: CoB--CoM heterodisulfide reductase iron-sulfur subunit B family protein [Anaerolineae bacterium]
MRYAYYPGCSLGAGEREYDLSVRAVFARLGIELLELEDWNCCGAVHSDLNDRDVAITLPARNLALAEAQGFETIVAPCSGCYKNLRRASKAVADDRSMRRKVNASLKGDLALEGNVTVMHPLYVLRDEYGLKRIKAQVVRPLTELRVASYYGCMLTRPRDIFDSPERPTALDELAAALGAQVVDYPLKAKCCGGALALSHAPVTARLTGKVLVSAKEAGADVISLACPMCHTALDGYQGKAESAMAQPIDLPVLFFTQLMGLALGIAPAELGLKRHIVPTDKVLTLVG